MPQWELLGLDHDADENVPPRQAHRLSRSPHPYHRHRQNVLQDHSTDLTLKRPTFLSPNVITTTRDKGPSYFDADHRKRRKRHSDPSDSGTEADDESGGFLRGLPPPPLKPRKGLKGNDDSGSASPLLTPSYLDDNRREIVLKAQIKRRASLQSQSCTDEEAVKIREIFKRRRRAELLRRVSETLLLVGVGFVVACGSEAAWLIRLWARDGLERVDMVWKSGLGHIPIALLCHGAVVLVLYAVYPFRIIIKNQARNLSQNRSRYYIHIPAAFEPAPLLYPILIPVFVALLLLHVDETALFANLVLSIAAIPSKIIPLNSDVPWHSSIQWILSAIPIMASQNLHSKNNRAPSQEYQVSSSTIDSDLLLMLYPLHQTLLPVLGYLTTTSLLPAELQLLSVSMTNLLIQSTSPQSVILQSLLWMGGISIFVSCAKILTLEVALARIPSWRFKQSYSKSLKGNIILFAIDDSLNGRLSRWGFILPESETSDSNEERSILSARRRKAQRLRVETSTLVLREDKNSFSPTMKKVPLSAVGGNGTNSGFSALNQEVTSADSENQRQRRATLPSYCGSDINPPLQTPKPWSLRSMSRAQAVVIKWFFAFYVYAAIVFVIAVPIRSYIRHKALHCREPVGWALGYLFGDIPLVRYYVSYWNLDGWILLPLYTEDFFVLKGHDWTIQPQWRPSGAANVRLLICVYCLSVIATGLIIVLRLSASVEVDTRRKVFHGMMVVMFLPTIFVDPAFISLALILILAVFLLLDLFRASQLPPVSGPLTYFLAPYVDGRDHRGPVIVSHIFLLTGCAIPLWLSLARVRRSGEAPWDGWDVEARDLSMVSGVVCVGMGDAAASLMGRRFGRRRWCWSGGKSLEGSFSFAVAVMIGLGFARLWLLIGGWPGDSGDAWVTTMVKASVAAAGASLTEAVLTGGNDNVIVPVILWLLVRGLNL